MLSRAKRGIASRVFFGLAILNLFTFIICIAAIYSFRDSANKFDQVTETLLPQIIVAADLGNQSSNLASRSAELIGAGSLLELDTVILRLGDQIDAVSRIEKKLAASSVSKEVLGELSSIRAKLDENLVQLMELVKKAILLKGDITKQIALVDVITHYSEKNIRQVLLGFAAQQKAEYYQLNSELGYLLSDWSELSNQALLNIATTSEISHPIQLVRQQKKFQQLNELRMQGQLKLLNYRPELEEKFNYVNTLFSQIGAIYQLREALFKTLAATQGVLTIHTHLSDVLVDFTSKLSTEFESKALLLSADIHEQFSQRTLLFLLGLALFFAVAGIVFYYVDHHVVSRIQLLTRRIQEKESVPADNGQLRGDEIADIDHSLTYFISEIEAREQLLESERGKAIQANHAKSRLLAAASHDLRQPLHAIVLMLSSLQDYVEKRAGRQVLADINKSVTDLSSMFDSILDLSDTENIDHPLAICHFNIQTVLDRIEQEFRPLAITKKIRLVVARSDITIYAHRESTHRILANLVSNGIKYTQVGEVSLHLEVGSRDVMVSVSDTGSGIAKDQRSRVFDERYQASKQQQGHGLGLAISQELALKMGLKIELTETPTHSTKFQISIPRGSASLIENSPEPAAPIQLTSMKGLAIVLVEDERDIRLACESLLNKWGCHVTAFSEFSAASQYIESTIEPFVLITDLHLGRSQSGIKLAQAVSQKNRLVIITSASQFPKESLDQGIKFLKKPFSPAQLATILRGFIRKSG